MPHSNLLDRYGSQLRQAARVLIGCALTYTAYRMLHLAQGYWAVFTVIIVLQGSIATTLGAALDRLFGTIAGALIGGIATVAIQHGDVTIGVALVVVVGITAFAAAVRPQLKVAPVTAAILLLTQPQGMPVLHFVIDRIVEIALGGLIGVAVSVLVFPARSQPLVIARAAAVLEQMQRILGVLAAAVGDTGTPALAGEHGPLRAALGAVEQAARDAERERASGLAYGAPPPVIARALWRIRNDLILVARAIDLPLPAPAAHLIAAPATALLAAEAEYAGRCATALRAGTAAATGDEQPLYQAFEEAFGSLRQSGLIRTMDFADAGRVFGLAFAIEILHRDLADLGGRLGQEIGKTGG
ncbi:FUSC family protein [Sphingomonas sp. AP4-R1]|uniref:FUSC family protein n=1 Tax=Sphingomonas sp. AP4-R1 TaxID=2735134 RepID=UPI001493B2CA|nr:FUSC family protein [Sphingomonas sp. AP4-R1]QJU57919.1 FUSC family protein [Sphingomonas sp. AP4-R1]